MGLRHTAAGRRRHSTIGAVQAALALLVVGGAALGALLLRPSTGDAWTVGVTAPPGRPQATPALAAAAVTAVVLLAAEASVADTSWARLPASLAIAATTGCLVLALRTRHTPPG
ncbi:hypothetical protein [Streptomyces collinus]|uniref:hypothetical protein n=1 Tax=Streptomyces collinus TaxID=42684 RepID=UPI0036E6A5EF